MTPNSTFAVEGVVTSVERVGESGGVTEYKIVLACKDSGIGHVKRGKPMSEYLGFHAYGRDDYDPWESLERDDRCVLYGDAVGAKDVEAECEECFIARFVSGVFSEEEGVIGTAKGLASIGIMPEDPEDAKAVVKELDRSQR